MGGAPAVTQLAFALERIKALAPQHPEWKSKQPFKAVLDNDLGALSAAGENGVVELITVSHAGMSTAELETTVTGWLDSARHPCFKRPYTELAYQPMLHDDGEREYAYGPANGLADTKFGTFPASLMNEAKEKGWVVISMKNDWKQVFAPEP